MRRGFLQLFPDLPINSIKGNYTEIENGEKTQEKPQNKEEKVSIFSVYDNAGGKNGKGDYVLNYSQDSATKIYIDNGQTKRDFTSGLDQKVESKINIDMTKVWNNAVSSFSQGYSSPDVDKSQENSAQASINNQTKQILDNTIKSANDSVIKAYEEAISDATLQVKQEESEQSTEKTQDKNSDYDEIPDRYLSPFKVIYDAEGKVSQKLCYNEDGDEVTVDYDKAGHMIKITQGTRTTDLKYENDLLISEVESGITIDNGRGDADKKVFKAINYKYDDAGKMISKNIRTSIGHNVLTTYEYDNQGRVIQENYTSTNKDNNDYKLDVIYKNSYDEDGKKTISAFLPSGEEFASENQAILYLAEIRYMRVGGEISEQDLANLKSRYKFKKQ